MSLTSPAAVPQATAGDKPFDFVALPFEVKELIYKHAIFAGRHFDSAIFGGSNLFRTDRLCKHLPAICFTNKLERIIACRLYLRYKTVNAAGDSDPPALQAFLSQYGQANEGLRWLKNVCFGHFRRRGNGFRNAIDLVKVCTALKAVVFHIRSEDLYQWYGNRSEKNRHSTGSEILERLNLHGLIDCDHMTKVRFGVLYGRHMEMHCMKSMIKGFSRAFSGVHGPTAANRLDLSIEDECGLIWELKPQA
ncbi:hypothetical protein J4E91_008088 [Alternaria rosae]|nr:hypothetical protein J4E91_008088 [Alternaria rosae]